eukprot:8000942-Pyramimonas_sp.AAC.1
MPLNKLGCPARAPGRSSGLRLISIMMYQSPCSWSKRHPATRPLGRRSIFFEPLEYDGPAADRCPRPLQHAVLSFLHLFSGAMRTGDVLEELGCVLMTGPVTSIVISCDVACDLVDGDLTRGAIACKWDLLSSRSCHWPRWRPSMWDLVCCEVAGAKSCGSASPTCSASHSQAGGVVRNVSARRQHQQLSSGSPLLLSQRQLMLIGLEVGARARKEHPEVAHWEERAPGSWQSATPCAL